MRAPLLLSLMLASCAHKPPQSVNPNCITDEYAEPVKVKMEAVLDQAFRSAGQDIPPLQLISQSCLRRKYQKGGHTILLSSNPENLPRVQGAINKTIDPLLKKKCLSDAMRAIEELQIPFANRVFSLSQQKQPDLWNDEDLGPSAWLACPAKDQVSFYAGIETLLHEESHHIRTENCLFVSSQVELVCFNFSGSLPLRSIARLKEFPTKVKAAIPILDFFEKTYLTNIDGSFFLLLDEIQAYATGLAVTTQALKIKGKSSILEEATNSKSRSYVALPQMLNYGVNYLVILRRDYPELFSELIKSHENMRGIREVFSVAEESYRLWLNTLRKHGLPIKEPEANFWKLYSQSKRSLKL